MRVCRYDASSFLQQIANKYAVILPTNILSFRIKIDILPFSYKYKFY